jgi:uncharacterized membrane protein
VTLAPLLASSPTVLFTATAALIIGAAVLFLPKGTPRHRQLGGAWAALMMATAALSLGITTLNPGHFSAIHILSIVTLTTVPYAVWRRRVGDIRAHAIAMVSNYLGLLIAGAFTLAPGRVIHAVVFG